MSDRQGIGGVGEPLKFQLRANLGGSPKVSVEPKRSIELTVALNHTGKDTSPVAAQARSPRIESHIIPTATFLAQHISQEVVPKAPGMDQYAFATHAYSQARDINLEVLSQGPELRIKI